MPTVQLRQAETEDEGEEEEDEEATILVVPVMKPHKSKRKTSKLDGKGKGIVLFAEKPKKNFVENIDEVPWIKRKFLDDSNIVALI